MCHTPSIYMEACPRAACKCSLLGHLSEGDGVADARVCHRLNGCRQVAHLARIQPVNLLPGSRKPPFRISFLELPHAAERPSHRKHDIIRANKQDAKQPGYGVPAAGPCNMQQAVCNRFDSLAEGVDSASVRLQIVGE